MFNYLRSQWYRTVHRKYLYITLAAIWALGALYLFLAKYAIGSLPIGMEICLGEITALTPYLGFYAVLLINDGTFSDERRLGTFKNDVAFGFSRGTLFFGKFIHCLTFCILAMVLLVAPILFMGIGIVGVFDWEEFRSGMALFGQTMLAAFPVWLCGAAAANALSCVMRKGVQTALVYAGAFVLGDLFLYLLGRLYPVWDTVKRHLPMGLLNDLSNGRLQEDSGLLPQCWIMGLVLTAVFTAAGYLVFRRAEVK